MKLITIGEAAEKSGFPEVIFRDFLRTGFKGAPKIYFFDANERIEVGELETWLRYVRDSGQPAK